MKKQLCGFLAGAMTMLLLVGLAAFALAATGRMSIEVDPINIQVDGETFQPKDVNGKNVPVFAYNGTTYAPLRALAEAYGLTVGYDAARNMATVTKPADTAQGAASESPDFRNANWGATAAEVKKSETMEPWSADDVYVMYEDTIANMVATVGYKFDDNGKLYQTFYHFNEEYGNKNAYINDYNRLVRMLTEKYGEPEYNEPTWKGTLFKDDPSNYGLAISRGDLSYLAHWETPTTRVDLSLSGGTDYEVWLGIYYESKTYQAVTDSATAGL